MKSRRATASNSQASIATTVAERGLSSIKPISPKYSPRPRMLRITSLPSASLIITLRRPESTMYSDSIESPAAMMIEPRVTLRRVTTVASRRKGSSAKFAKSGTERSIADETATAM